jgi:hypothetical protein
VSVYWSSTKPVFVTVALSKLVRLPALWSSWFVSTVARAPLLAGCDPEDQKPVA